MNYILLYLFLFLSNVTILHEFHVSKCLIKYDVEEEAIQISMHIFLDDLESALAKYGATDLKLCTDKEEEGAEVYIHDYLTRQFQIIHNEESLPIQFIGKEISEDLAAVWCYLEVTGVSAKGQLELKNEILLDLFDDQKNITTFSLLGKKEYFLFQKGESSDKIHF